MRNVTLSRPPRRRLGVAGVVGIIALAAIATTVVVWYGVPFLNERTHTWAENHGWLKAHDDLSQQLAKLKSDFSARMADIQQRTKNSGEEFGRRVQLQIDKTVASGKEQLAQLESKLNASWNNKQNESNKVATVQEELNKVRMEMEHQVAELNDELTALRHQAAERATEADRTLREMRDQVNTNAEKNAVERVDFEVTKNHSRQIAPGISLGVTGTNTTSRQVTGWLWLTPERKTIWLKDQNAQQPLTFYGNNDGRKRELVITNVTADTVSGYLLLPKKSTAAAAGDKSGE